MSEAPREQAPAPPSARTRIAGVVLPLAAIATLASPMPALGLLAGVVLVLALGNPYARLTGALATLTLQISVVLLGFGMDVFAVLRAGRDGALAAFIGIALTLFIGRLIGRALKVASTTSWLVCIGTAICGGSAIAACAPVLGASDDEVSASAGTVFLLNAVALFTFPTLGHLLHLDDRAFAMLAALAIHDTSSVVGAASAYSHESLVLATTVKLARALFILPLPLFLAFVIPSERKGAAKKPWFIIGFLAAAALVSFVPELHDVGHALAGAGKRGLSLALFLVGLGLSARTLRAIGPRPLILGVVLWALVTTGTVGALLAGIL